MPTKSSVQKPVSLRRAIAVLWASVVVSVAVCALEVHHAIEPPDVAVSVAEASIEVLVMAFIAVTMGGRGGWVRWLFAGYYVLASLTLIGELTIAADVFFAQPLLLQALRAVEFTLQTSALIFMFTSSSRRWFGQHTGQAIDGALSQETRSK